MQDSIRIETLNNGWLVTESSNFTGHVGKSYVFTTKRKLGEWVAENVSNALDKQKAVKKS